MNSKNEMRLGILIGEVTYIAIDPGASGAVVWNDRDEQDKDTLYSEYLPSAPYDLFELLNYIVEDARCYERSVVFSIENVGSYVPGNSGPAAVKFAKHVGHLEMALVAITENTSRCSWDKVTPAKWMKEFLVTLPNDKDLNARKKKRKNAIKEKAKRLYPGLKVTLKNADAIGMWHVLSQKG